MSRASAPPQVTSRTHPLVQRMRRQARGRTSDDATCLLDGVHLVAMALDLGRTFEAVLVDQASSSHEVAALVRRLTDAGVPTTSATTGVLDAASPVQSPSPIVALVDAGPASLAEALAGAASSALIVLVDAVQDPGNIGAIVRTADAAGAAAVICAGACADPFGWKALRGSMGSALRLPVCVVPSLAEAITALAGAQVAIFALDARATADVHDARWPDRVALAVGREGAGLDATLCARADALVRITMRAGVESLNVAVATGIALYAARRAHQGLPAGGAR